MALADLDGDEDVDAWRSDFIQVYRNLERQVAWRDVPRIGRPLAIDVHGQAGSPWTLFVSAKRARTQTKFGLLQLFAPAAWRIGSGQLDASGQAERVYSVPNDAALVGAEFWLQGLQGSPLRFSNLERVSFLDL